MACESGCTGSCTGTCAGSCSGGCRGSCKNSCSGKCKGYCKGTCKGLCVGSCQTSCENKCANACQLQCENGQTIESNSVRNNLKFNWSTNICQKEIISIKAVDWNQLGKNIIAASDDDICGGTCENIKNSVQSKDIITAEIYNSYITALVSVASASSLTPVQGGPRGTIITSTRFKELSDALNSAPLKNITCCQLGEYCVQHCNNSRGRQSG